MDAEQVISRLKELQEKYGKHINVLVDHEEILMIAYRSAIPQEEAKEYININSEDVI